MTNLNMVKLNMLIKKGYLLAGVMMAANMFVVNEVRAMESTKKNETEKGINNVDETGDDKDNLNSLFKNVLSCKNYINFICGIASSGANNYFKWWNYNPGIYWSLGCYGWRSGRFLKDIFQFDINFNIGRGAGWMVLYFLDLLYLSKTKSEGEKNEIQGDIAETNDKEKNLKEEDTSKKTQNLIENSGESKKTTTKKIKDFIFSCAPGFISAPLTIHISKFDFSISISIDSIVYGVVEFVSNKCGKNKKTKDAEEIKDDSITEETPIKI